MNGEAGRLKRKWGSCPGTLTAGGARGGRGASRQTGDSPQAAITLIGARMRGERQWRLCAGQPCSLAQPAVMMVIDVQFFGFI